MRTSLTETDRVAAKAVPKLRNPNALPERGVNSTLIPIGAKTDSGGDSQRAQSLNLWRQVLGGRGHGCSDRIAGGF